MERWRWLPPELASAPIVVNIPQFRLFAFDSTKDTEARIRQMDVIVGKDFEATQTPVFTADMKYLIFRPYWEVPYSIAVKEIVPEARANAASIEKHQIDIPGANEAIAKAAASDPDSANLTRRPPGRFSAGRAAISATAACASAIRSGSPNTCFAIRPSGPARRSKRP